MARKKLSQPEESTEVVKIRELSPETREVLRTHFSERFGELAMPKIKVTRKPGGTEEWGYDHPNQGAAQLLMTRALGTTSFSFADKILRDVFDIARVDGVTDEVTANFVLAVIDGIKPRDELETMMATQMAAVHVAVVKQARRLAHVETLPQLETNERALNKLARTFTTQMEALKRYRTGGEQKVTVHHVTVNEGGQAIVGIVEQKNGSGEGVTWETGNGPCYE